MLLTKKEVAKYLRVSEQTVKRLTLKGALQSIPHEHHTKWFYLKTDIDRFLTERSDTMAQ